MRAVLAKQGDPVDSKLPETDVVKLAFQHRRHGLVAHASSLPVSVMCKRKSSIT